MDGTEGVYDAQERTDVILSDMEACQGELHKWGKANQVAFDASKESMHILSRTQAYGDPFVLLGVSFDCKLTMSDSVHELTKSCRWKLRAILRTQRFHTGAQLVTLYKAQILSYIEYRTAAIYHACDTSLQALDHVQEKLIEAAGMSAIEALNECKLAPLWPDGIWHC